MAKTLPHILSGMRPTGPLHIGNYLGALKNWVRLQDQYKCFFMIADLHALDTESKPTERRDYSLQLAAEYLAAGLDPKKSTIFIQSQVPAHAELSWIFGSLVPVGELERMTQYKDKASKGTANITGALFNYPILMAADILLYKPPVVPVGDDQAQHVEMARYVARHFNGKYGEYFPEPKPLLTPAPRLMSLTEPTRKMSKSEPAGCLFLTDSVSVIETKIKKAVTATAPRTGQMSPGVANLFTLLSECGAANDVLRQFQEQEQAGTIRYSELKEAVSQVVIAEIGDYKNRYNKLMTESDKLEKILQSGAKSANKIAAQTLEEVKEKIGLLI